MANVNRNEIYDRVKWNEIEPKEVEGVPPETLNAVKRRIIMMYDDEMQASQISMELAKDFGWMDTHKIVTPCIMGYVNWLRHADVAMMKVEEGKKMTAKEEESFGELYDMFKSEIVGLIKGTKSEERVKSQGTLMEVVTEYERMYIAFQKAKPKLRDSTDRQTKAFLMHLMFEMMEQGKTVCDRAKLVDRYWR